MGDDNKLVWLFVSVYLWALCKWQFSHKTPEHTTLTDAHTRYYTIWDFTAVANGRSGAIKWFSWEIFLDGFFSCYQFLSFYVSLWLFQAHSGNCRGCSYLFRWETWTIYFCISNVFFFFCRAYAFVLNFDEHICYRTIYVFAAPKKICRFINFYYFKIKKCANLFQTSNIWIRSVVCAHEIILNLGILNADKL